MELTKGYRLASGVQVRKESFGLLFYDYKGPRLYFVPSKDLLTDSFFNGDQSVKDVTDSLAASGEKSRKKIQEHILKLLDIIEAKGLIYGQSIC